MPGEPGIAEEVVRAVARALAELGHEREVVATAGIVRGSAADALLDDAAIALADPGIGLTVARRLPLGALGALDYALCTSATLRDALQLTAQYYGVASQRVRLELIDTPAHAGLAFHRAAGIAHSRQWIELSAAAIAIRIRQTIGADATVFSRVTFQHGSPASAEAYVACFGIPAELGAATDNLAFAPALLDRPLYTASRELANALLAQLRTLEAAQSARTPLVVEVIRALGAMLDQRSGEGTVEAVSTRLGVTKRTLQRRLAHESTSVAALFDDVRRERAMALFEDGQPMAEVARRLGFADSSTFFRAYRRWTGIKTRSR